MPNTTPAFKTQIEEAIKTRLGADALERMSMEELVTRLGLSMSRETLRKILRGGHVPREKVQKQVLLEISTPLQPPSPHVTAEEFYGSTTAAEISGLLRHDALFANVESSPGGNSSDLLINQLGGHRLLVRCLDDQVRDGLASEDYFQPTVDRLVEAMRLLDIDRSLLITHTTPSPRAERMADAVKVTIQTYAGFIQQVVDIDKIERSLHEKLARRGIDRGFLALPAYRIIGDSESNCANSFETLLTFLEEAKGVGVATIVGSYGSGKTSLALRVAHKIADRSAKDKNNWILPLWVSARISDQSNVRVNLPQELSTALRLLTPTTHIGPETLCRLVSSGRIWLFVDGLDEAITLRSRERLRHFLDALLDYCQPHGRIVLTIRQEVFNNQREEVEFFHEGMLIAGAKETLLLRTRPMNDDQIGHIIHTRREKSEANRLILEIQNSQGLQDLVTRPGFLDILTKAGALPEAKKDSSAVLQLFETYVEQWAEEEQRRTIRLDLPPYQRLEICELMALYAIRYGDKEGISSEDIEKFARDLGMRITIRNMEAFVIEARVAMFLERVSQVDRFLFSHQSLRSFFVARRVGREIAENEDFKHLESFALDHADPLLSFFIIERIRERHANPLELLERTLENAVHGYPKPEDSTWRSPFRVGPCFSYLVPNLTALIVYLRSEAKNFAPIHLEGAHLAKFNLDSILGSQPQLPLILTSANLEGATLNGWPRAIVKGAITQRNGSRELVRRYCSKHGLFEPARFSIDPRDRFILIPGGTYHVRRHRDGDQELDREFSEVHLRSYLIQSYPVTNRQFLSFLDAYPQFLPETVREQTANDYYLLNWPDHPRDVRRNDRSWLDRPVVHVNWIAADAFARACGLRLPTEVEWEVASRYDGTDEAKTLRPWGDEIDRDWGVYWGEETHDGERGADTNTQGNQEESPPLLPSRIVYELQPKFEDWAQGREVPYYMVDFVREWVADHWDPNYPCLEPRVEPFSYFNDDFEYNSGNGGWHLSDGRQVLRVLRGGSFQTTDNDCTSEYRAPHPPKNVNPDGGFRCVRPVRVPWARNESKR